MSDVMKQCEGDVEAIGEQELALLVQLQYYFVVLLSAGYGVC